MNLADNTSLTGVNTSGQWQKLFAYLIAGWQWASSRGKLCNRGIHVLYITTVHQLLPLHSQNSAGVLMNQHKSKQTAELSILSLVPTDLMYSSCFQDTLTSLFYKAIVRLQDERDIQQWNRSLTFHKLCYYKQTTNIF